MNQTLFKRLPHIDYEKQFQFITFRTYDSIDDFVIRLQSQEMDNSRRQYELDVYLDKIEKGRYLNGEVLDFLKSHLFRLDGKSFQLFAFAIMPNHVHILLQQIDSLSKILQHIKGGSSVEINRILNRSGTFWAKDYYDKGIRDELHFKKVYDYIMYNPVKAELKDCALRVYSRYEDCE
jgi:REP element-mobilizing transposase RayT